LGLAWVIAPLVTGLVLVGVGAFVLLRPHPPGARYVRATTVAAAQSASRGVPVDVAGTAIIVRSAGAVGLQAASATGEDCYPLLTYRGDVYVDVTATPTPCAATFESSPAATGT
jgi:hypothetical protein